MLSRTSAHGSLVSRELVGGVRGFFVVPLDHINLCVFRNPVAHLWYVPAFITALDMLRKSFEKRHNR